GAMSGRVVLVGAGPGDPGLLTVHGQRWLAAADVVVHDDLVHRRILEAVRPDAEVVAVGRPHGEGDRLSQAEIETLLIDRARAGKIVVRLKNGDPFVFGRGAEEAQALRAAGVPFEVVPGVTSAIAALAYAGIPATHRDHASLVTIATGHQACPPGATEPGPPDLPWEALARQGGTLVFLMAVRPLAKGVGAPGAAGPGPAAPAPPRGRRAAGRRARPSAGGAGARRRRGGARRARHRRRRLSARARALVRGSPAARSSHRGDAPARPGRRAGARPGGCGGRGDRLPHHRHRPAAGSRRARACGGDRGELRLAALHERQWRARVLRALRRAWRRRAGAGQRAHRRHRSGDG